MGLERLHRPRRGLSGTANQCREGGNPKRGGNLDIDMHQKQTNGWRGHPGGMFWAGQGGLRHTKALGGDVVFTKGGGAAGFPPGHAIIPMADGNPGRAGPANRKNPLQKPGVNLIWEKKKRWSILKEPPQRGGVILGGQPSLQGNSTHHAFRHEKKTWRRLACTWKPLYGGGTQIPQPHCRGSGFKGALSGHRPHCPAPRGVPENSDPKWNKRGPVRRLRRGRFL